MLSSLEAGFGYKPGEFGWTSYLPTEMPTWKAISDINYEGLFDRVIHGWQVNLIMGAAVASVIQAVAAIFAGMLGFFLVSSAITCVLLFAASYVAQHHLIAETREQLAEAERHVENLQEQVGNLQNQIDRVVQAAGQLSVGVAGLDKENQRFEVTAERFETVIPVLERAAEFLKDPALQTRILDAQRTIETLTNQMQLAVAQTREADQKRKDFEASATVAQARYETTAKQLEEVTASLQRANQSLNTSVENAGEVFRNAAAGAQDLVASMHDVVINMPGSPYASSPFNRYNQTVV